MTAWQCTDPAQNNARLIEISARSVWLYAILFLICLCGALDWFAVRTHRLYVDEHLDATKPAGNVSEHFDIHGHTVIPEIVIQNEGHFVFPVHLRAPHTLVFKVKPHGGVASYQIHLRRGGERRLLVSETLSKSRARTISLPLGISELEFSGHGSLAWVDLSLVRKFFLWPVYLLAFLTFGVMTAKFIRARRMLVAEWITLLATILFFLAILETAIRFFASHLPPAIAAARHEFGLVGPDTRWIDPVRYKLRHRPNAKGFGEWRFGDLVRLGMIPKEVSPGTLHRYSFQTDAEGFRNATVREKIDIAALGDSFTDAANAPASDAWPSRLEELTGRIVQNYGTSGFGPQQELYVLRDYALKHKPHWTVLAYFAGNDISDAEAFDRWEHGLDRVAEGPTGWKLRDAFRRYETLYIWTISAFAADALRVTISPAEPPEAKPAVASPTFDRGMFTVPVANQTVRYALFPHYLQKLGIPRAEIERSRGWELTQAALRQMKADCDEGKSAFVLMFIPSKSEVYWPLTERSFAPARLQEVVNFYDRYNHVSLRAEDVHVNRLAQNAMLQAFCAQEKIPMLDLTPLFEREVENGHEVYFPDDTHWNAHAQDLAARKLAEFLATHP